MAPLEVYSFVLWFDLLEHVLQIPKVNFNSESLLELQVEVSIIVHSFVKTWDFEDIIAFFGLLASF